MTLTYSGSGGSEAMLTFKKKSIYGRIKLHHDRTFIIESVSSQVVWAEIGKVLYLKSNRMTVCQIVSLFVILVVWAEIGKVLYLSLYKDFYLSKCPSFYNFCQA